MAQHFISAPADWMFADSIYIKLDHIPLEAKIEHIQYALAGCGNIVFIEFQTDRNGQRNGRGAVRFDPPPKRICWIKNRFTIDIDGRQREVKVIPQDTVRLQSILSPLNHRIKQRLSLQMTTMSFGMLVAPEKLMAMERVTASRGSADVLPPLHPDEGLKFTVDFKNRKMSLFSPVERTEDAFLKRQYKMIIRFDSIKQLRRIKLEHARFGLALALDFPPQYFRKRPFSKSLDAGADLKWSERDLWARATDICIDPTTKRDKPEKLHRDTDLIHLGRWTAFYLEVDGKALNTWENIEGILRDFNIHAKHTQSFECVPKTESQLWKSIEPAEPTATNASALALLSDDSRIHLPWDVIYQLQACLSSGYLVEQTITSAFLRHLGQLANPDSHDPDRARLILEYVCDQRVRVFDPMSLFKDQGARTYFPPHLSLPAHCVLMRKATITPTTLYFASPTIETTNRVIRQYYAQRDRFLRVQFTDEIPLGAIFARPNSTADDDIFTRVHRVLFQGIQIGDRIYEFLAFGNSQVRDACAYFFAPTREISCDAVRQWMGWERIIAESKTVAKAAARLGLCFSTTRVVYGVRCPHLIEIPDIMRNGYCFTDGVGKISSFLAQSIAYDWRLDKVPSVFQFRWGGCKGILVVNPALKGPIICIRPSQKKFEASYKVLEIIKCSQYSTASLNRQTITLLSNLGVPNHVFLDMLKTQLNEYDEALRDPHQAVKLLSQFVDENQMTLTIAQMIANGFMDEPFVNMLVHLWRSWCVKLLKEKARLFVKDSAFVFGCVDEMGILRGHLDAASETGQESLPQIFLQVPDQDNPKSYKTILGPCLLGRNPSLHPGDVRVVEAIDVPGLRHLRDVVVFPQQGDRDLPGMCSGGDLDGDDFWVIWDQKLLPPRERWNQPPMDFTAPPPIVHGRPITVDDLRTFFVLYMKNNSLPTIAHAHLGMADWLTPLHSEHPTCLELAGLHSKAVDYVKSGEPAVMRKDLQPRAWPHWMEKRGRSYHSYGVLGQMFDLTKPVDFHPSFDAPFDQRVLGRFRGENALSSAVLKKAREIKTQYDVSLRRIMGQLELRTEFEAWSTFVLSKPKTGSSYKLQENLGRQIHQLKQTYRGVCEDAAGGRDFEMLAPFVAGMYQVTQEEVEISLREARRPHVHKNGSQSRRQLESMPLISFPWVFDHILARLATGREEGTVSLRAEGFDVVDQAAARPPKLVSYMKQGGAAERGEELEWERNSDGQVVHRGQVLRLFFGVEDEEEDILDYGEDPDAGKRLSNGSSGSSEQSSHCASGSEVSSIPVVAMSRDGGPILVNGADELEEGEIEYECVVMEHSESAIDRAAQLGL
jgi:RNA-dependent RNA polymerase